jgi:hypothetical protein
MPFILRGKFQKPRCRLPCHPSNRNNTSDRPCTSIWSVCHPSPRPCTSCSSCSSWRHVRQTQQARQSLRRMQCQKLPPSASYRTLPLTSAVDRALYPLSDDRGRPRAILCSRVVNWKHPASPPSPPPQQSPYSPLQVSFAPSVQPPTPIIHRAARYEPRHNVCIVSEWAAKAMSWPHATRPILAVLWRL